MKVTLGNIDDRTPVSYMCEDLWGAIYGDKGYIPPKYSVSEVVGYLKGKSAIMIARQFAGQTRNFKGQSFWVRGYFVSTVGLDEQMVREYIRNQNERDKYFDQAELSL